MPLHFHTDKFECVTTEAQLNRWLKLCREAKSVCFDTETTGLDVFTVDLVGCSLAVEIENQEIIACYIPLAHDTKAKQLPLKKVVKALKPILEDPDKPIIFQNALYDMAIMSRYGVNITNIHDSMLMSYSLTAMADAGGHGMDYLALKYLKYRTVKFGDVVVEALGMKTFAEVDLPKATYYAAEDGAVTLMLAKVLQAYLVKRDLWRVYDEIDRPLLPVLHDMQMRGVKVDVPKLTNLKTDWTKLLLESRAEMWKLAGYEFNPSSPTQLAQLMYDELKLPCWATTKSGARSTAKAVLEAMEGEHPVIDAILDYREISKLIGTYCDKLPGVVNPKTGRVHASTRVTVTRTGRLSMTEGLHQIPTRARKGKPLRGRQIREAFLAEKGLKLVCADYSQIEVRVLAHVSQDPTLLQAFRDGIDAHEATAKAAFGVEKPTKDQRSAAKTITFGLIYGMGAASLARRLGISLHEAEDFIDQYFDAMPTVREWIDSVHSFARQHGYVETLFGRRIHIPHCNSRDSGMQKRAMRQAVNYIIQGSAADLMRLALSTARNRLHNMALHNMALHNMATVLLSVHDEIIVECSDDVVAAVVETLSEAMQTCSAEWVEWSVPIVAEASAGQTWREAKGDE